MSWATPEERRNLGQSRRKQLGRQQNDQLNIKARKAAPSPCLSAPSAAAFPRCSSSSISSWRSRPSSTFVARLPLWPPILLSSPIPASKRRLCGDAHVRNLGAFAAPDGRLVFDINDFDETIRGPFEWDLKRMAASLVLAGRESRHKESSARDAVQHCIHSLLRTHARLCEVCLCSKSPAFRSIASETFSPSPGPAESRARHSSSQSRPAHRARSRQTWLRRFKEIKPYLTPHYRLPGRKNPRRSRTLSRNA